MRNGFTNFKKMDPDKINQLKLRFKRDSDIGIHGILDSEAIRYQKENEEYDIRSPFFRDSDRIVHSKAYARYIDKSQVFFELDVFNANITHRSLHVILVSRLARQIGRILKLNTDLIEAISLAHDIGHSPYGHLGEQILNEISQKYNLGRYCHNAQGIRWLTKLEKRFPKKPAKGLNLTLQVLDGVLCHDGEINEQKLRPKKINDKTWEDHFREYDDCLHENKIKRIPMSYEGIAVRFADTISYIGRDIEDAVLLGFINREDIPKECKDAFGDTNREIINTLMMDLLRFSIDNDIIGYSESTYETLKILKDFNYNNIYNRRDLYKKDNSNQTFIDILRNKFNLIFERIIEDLGQQNYASPVFKDHIDYIDDPSYSTYYIPLKEKGKLTLIARDYIAGMSDKYFNEIYDRLH